MEKLQKYNFFNDVSEFDSIYINLPLYACPHCGELGFLKNTILFTKKLEPEPKAVIIGKRLYCTTKQGGCGQTIRLQTSYCLFYLWYSIYVVWKFFSLHYIESQSIQSSYESATQTSNPRNAFRWLNKLNKKIPFLKDTIPPPAILFTHANDIKFFLQHFTALYSPHNPLLFFQTAFQKHALCLFN